MNQDILVHVGEIIAAHVGSNSVVANDLPAMIVSVYEALDKLGAAPLKSEPAPIPAVSLRASVKPDAITCLDCGAKFKTLRRHIGGHGLTEAQYRAKWSLPDDYPMTAADYSALRTEMAKSIRLGKKKADAAPTVRKQLRLKV